FRQAALRAGTGLIRVGPAVTVCAQRGDGFVLGERLHLIGGSRHSALLPESFVRPAAGCAADGVEAVFCTATNGTWVVHAQSPLAIVASRGTWVPSRSRKASSSASHSCGNSSATWATGQWC